MPTKSLLTLALFLLAPLTPAQATPTHLPAPAFKALHSATLVILYATDPNPRAFHWPGSRWFHGYRIRGAVRVTDPIQQHEVAAVLERCATTPGDNAKCIFQPRHAVRVVTDARVYDFVICFQCSEMEVHAGDQIVAQRSFHTSAEPLNRILQAAHIKLAQ